MKLAMWRVAVVLGAVVAILPARGFAADAMDARRDQMLAAQLKRTYPPDGYWFYEDRALAAYYLKQNAQGDQAILDERQEFAKDPKLADFHWHAFMLERVYFLFGRNSKFFPGRMSPAAEKALLEMIWQWASPNGSLEMADPKRDWWVWGSENHHLMSWGSMWGACKIFAAHPEYKARTFGDQSTMADAAKAFDEYFKRWLTNRAGCGMFVEVGSAYNHFSLGVLSNLVDFADDPVLRNRARMFMDLFWADWAIEQIDSYRGGSRHRCYPGRDALEEGVMRAESWFLFGTGVVASQHPSNMCMATSTYRPDPIVASLVASAAADRGVYAYISRRPGHSQPGVSGSAAKEYVPDANSLYHKVGLVYELDSKCAGLLRYTWCTGDFVMGTSMVAALPRTEWTGISAQNRWDGVIFGGHATARIFVQPTPASQGSFYNAYWSVQNKGVLIVQRQKEATATGSQVYFDASLKRQEKDGWVFAEAPRAYAAVRVVQGKYTWQADTKQQHHEPTVTLSKGQWLACEDEFSPIIMEVARKADYRDMAAFQKAILSNALDWQSGRLEYKSAGYKTTLALWADYSQPPQVDGQPVDYDHAKVYDSPFIQSDFGSGVVTIRKGERSRVLDFTK